MPQFYPMNWFFIYMMIMLIFIFIMTSLYFLPMNKLLTKSTKNFILMKTWKW
uniref:ATP synthase F0 subunit 8 n=1 Tax=Chiropterargas boueti TaxID=1827022 RepID=A0A1P8AG52_9ACAR|nr:ATP synthase F0 subunit 8 [Chiropterargas boueti]AMX74069.1 ATP synthase F0 subunit 8 [Chiropterargas boueti]AMX74082.1 ATP synthase F0 subunit 8 [Chiropterargas boueti]